MPYGGNPASNKSDELRLLVGDTDADNPVLTDEEVAYYLAQAEDNALRGAWLAALDLAARFAKKMDKSIGETRISYSQQLQQYNDLANRLQARGGFNNSVKMAAPFAGGLDSPLRLQGEWGPTDRHI